jgi:hypothetical protein
MEYYLTLKRNEELIHGTLWMNLENMLSKRRQTQKATYNFIYRTGPEEAYHIHI